MHFIYFNAENNLQRAFVSYSQNLVYLGKCLIQSYS